METLHSNYNGTIRLVRVHGRFIIFHNEIQIYASKKMEEAERVFRNITDTF